MINCIIIDDEPMAQKGLSEYVAEVSYLTLAGVFDNPLAATELIAGGTIQLIFLDIELPLINGLQFIQTLKDPPPVIFTTAYPQYAVAGFEVDALDYLVKPISFERFLKAVSKASDYYEAIKKNTDLTDYFFIKSENRLIKILTNQILFVEGLQNYVSIYTHGKKYISYLTFKSVEQYLPPVQFLKVHKSFIVACDKVDSIEGNMLRIQQHQVPVSRSLRDDVFDKLLNGKYLRRSQ